MKIEEEVPPKRPSTPYQYGEDVGNRRLNIFGNFDQTTTILILSQFERPFRSET